MAKGSLNIVEMHVEKLVLAGAGGFLVLMMWWYLIQTPNRITFENQTVTPGELDEAVLASAQRLQDAVRRAEPEPYKEESFSQELLRRQQTGIFAKSDEKAPPLPAVLPRTVSFGKKIEIPGLEETEDAPGSIALVTPLRPSPPKVRTGRSLVVPAQIELSKDPAAQPSGARPTETQASDQGWVSVAAYFNTTDQRNEMTRAGYAPYRSKVYVVGADAQRQEMLSNGEWSEWQDVKPQKSMPELEIPEVVLDPQTGALLNKDEIEQTFNLVRQRQNDLMQPAFFAIRGGDEWKVPPLPGFEETEEAEELATIRPVRAPKEPREPRRPAYTPPPIRAGGGGGGKGGGGGGGKGGMSTGGEMGGGGGGVNTARIEGRKRAEQEVKEARAALKNKDYAAAQSLAQSVLGNEDGRSQHGAAKKILAEAEAALAKQQTAGGGEMGGGGGKGGTMGGGEMPGGGGGKGGMVGGGGFPSAGEGGGKGGMMGGGGFQDNRSTTAEPTALVKNPDTSEPALFFHDDTVTPGKTYRYRIRAKIWNRYVGRMRALQNPEDAKKPVIVGDWSLPSDPITVTPTSYFFTRGAMPNNEGATFDVFKWRNGKWIKQTFEVAIGDIIGGARKVRLEESGESNRVDIDFTTGALVLDLNYNEHIRQRVPGREGQFNYIEKNSMTTLYLDPADGQVKQKVQLLERLDSRRKQLEGGEG